MGTDMQIIYSLHARGVNLAMLSWLPHWGRDKMDVISQRTFSTAFSWMKMFEFRLQFHWNLFPRVQLTIFQHWFRKWLDADKATSQYLNQWWLVYWRIYASLGLNELTGLKWSNIDKFGKGYSKYFSTAVALQALIAQLICTLGQ